MSEEKKELVREAEALGIDVDGRWGVETLQEKIKEREAVLAAQEGEDDGEGEAPDGETTDAGGGQSDVAMVQASEASGTGGEADAGTDGPGELPVSGTAAPLGERGSATVLAEGDAGSGEHAVEHDAERLLNDGAEVEAPIVDAGATETADVADPVSEGTDGADLSTSPDLPPAGAGDPGDAAAIEGDAAPDETGDAAAPAGDVVDGADGNPPEPNAAELSDELDALDHGDGSADGAAPDNWSFDEVREAVLALTMPLQSAFDCASAVYEKMTERQDPEPLNYLAWFCLDDSTNTIIALVSHAAPFVRSWPEAPVEALYGHVVSGGGVNLVLERPWADLPVEKRIAWTVFRDTLVTIDKALKAEWKAETPERVSRLVPIDETTLEEVDEPFATSEFAR